MTLALVTSLSSLMLCVNQGRLMSAAVPGIVLPSSYRTIFWMKK